MTPRLRVAVLGASPRPDRYSNMAVRLLREHGHDVVPVNPGHDAIEGIPAVADLDAIDPLSIDTVTVYVGPAHSDGLREAFARLNPRRVIFNPGAENPPLAAALAQAGIRVEDACTLVLLRTGAFSSPV